MPQALGSAFISLLLSIGAGNLLVAGSAALYGNIILGAALIAGQMLLRPATPKIAPSEAQQTIRQALPPRRRHYGRVRISGALWYIATDPAELDVLFMGLALNHGRIGSFVSFHVDENEVTIDGTGLVTSAPYYDGDADDNIHIYTRLGLATETAYSQMLATFAIADMRGDGIASMLVTADNYEGANTQMQAYPNGLPQIRATIEASVCWDPRNDTQDRTDESTWGWSENPVVCLLNYCMDADGYGMNWARFENNIAEWVDAMEVCDQLVALAAGGTEKRYRLAMSFDLTMKPRDVVAQMLAACDGKLWQRRDGTLGISVGTFPTPSVRITSEHIRGYRITSGQDQLTAVAGLRAQYMSPADDYREQEAEPWPTGAIVQELEEERVASLDLTMVPSGSQARRLMKRDYKRRTSPWRGTIWTDLYGMMAMDERSISVEIAELGLDTSFEIDKFTFEPATMGCQIDIVAVDASIDDWTTAEETVGA